MSDQMQRLLTVMLSSALCGLAGLWLADGKPKGFIVGGGAGAAAATGLAYQDRRLQAIAAQQRQIKGAAKPSPSPASQPAKQQLAAYQTQLSNLQSNLQLASRQNKLSRGELRSDIKRLRDSLEEIKLRLDQQATANRSYAAIPDAAPPRYLDLSDEDNSEAVSGSIGWFNGRRVDIESSYEPDPQIDDLLDGLSAYLGENYAILGRFHRKLRSNVGLKLYFNLVDHSQREISVHRQFIKQLRVSNFLKFGRIIKDGEKPEYIIATSHDRPDIKQFLTGIWFERYIYRKLAELFKAEGLEYECLRNPKISYANGDIAELDLFFLVDGQPLLIECKSGQNYDFDIEKFAQHRKRLSLEAERAIFVVLDIDTALTSIRSRDWQITVVDQTALLEHVKGMISGDEEEATEQNLGEEEPVTVPDTSGLAQFFKQRGLNLAPQYRSDILARVIALVEQEGPIKFSDLTKIIRDQLAADTGLARRKIMEVLNCLRYSGVFQDEARQPVRNVYESIYYLSSPIPRVLERKCMEFYARKILQQFDPDFFDAEGNVQAFEQLTQGKAPAPGKLAQYKEDIARLQTTEADDAETDDSEEAVA